MVTSTLNRVITTGYYEPPSSFKHYLRAKSHKKNTWAKLPVCVIWGRGGGGGGGCREIVPGFIGLSRGFRV